MDQASLFTLRAAEDANASYSVGYLPSSLSPITGTGLLFTRLISEVCQKRFHGILCAEKCGHTDPRPTKTLHLTVNCISINTKTPANGETNNSRYVHQPLPFLKEKISF